MCYDFQESNYAVHTINLTEVSQLDAGPALACAYIKTDDTLPAWIVVDGDGGDTDSVVYESM